MPSCIGITLVSAAATATTATIIVVVMVNDVTAVTVIVIAVTFIVVHGRGDSTMLCTVRYLCDELTVRE